MKTGQLVKVFQKPLTDEDYEGIGKVLMIFPGYYDTKDKLHQVMVLFPDHNEGVIRRVKEKNIVDPIKPKPPRKKAKKKAPKRRKK